MVISADFEKQKQYFDKKNIALSHYGFIAISFYRNIACQNCSSDEDLRAIILKIGDDGGSTNISHLDRNILGHSLHLGFISLTPYP